MTGEIRIPFGGQHFPKIKRYLEQGYMIVKEDTFPLKRVVLRTENKKGDRFCIKTYEDATHWLSGGFPYSHMMISKTVHCPTSGDKLLDGKAMWDKIKLGWKIKDYDLSTGYTVTCEEDVTTVANDIAEIKELTGYVVTEFRSPR